MNLAVFHSSTDCVLLLLLFRLFVHVVHHCLVRIQASICQLLFILLFLLESLEVFLRFSFLCFLFFFVDFLLWLGIGIETPRSRLWSSFFLGRLEAYRDFLARDCLFIHFLLLLQGSRANSISLPPSLLLLAGPACLTCGALLSSQLLDRLLLGRLCWHFLQESFAIFFCLLIKIIVVLIEFNWWLRRRIRLCLISS